MAREALLLLPGMMCDARLFSPQIEALGSDCEIVVPSLTGADTIEALASRVLAAAPERFNLAGLSMGGIVAMAMAARAPERISRLALLDTNHLAEPPERRANRDRQIEEVRNGRLRDVVADEMKPLYLAPANRSREGLLDHLLKMALDLGSEAFIAQSRALRDRTDLSHGLRRYPGPALVLCGAEDTLCPPDRHRQIAALLDRSEMIIVPDCGHISTLEAPDAVNEALRNWLARPAVTALEGNRNARD